MKTKKRIILFILIFVLLLGGLSFGLQKVALSMKNGIVGRSRAFATVSAEPKEDAGCACDRGQ